MPTPTISDIRLKVISTGLRSQREDLLIFGVITESDDLDLLAKELAEKGTWRGRQLSELSTKGEKLKAALTQADRIAKHIDDTAQEQEKNASVGGATWGQIWRGFTSNPFGFIGALFSALFEGIVGLFQGKGFAGFGEAFKKALGPLVAPAVAKDAGAALDKKLQDDPDLKKDLTDYQRRQIVHSFRNEIHEQGGASNLAPLPSAPQEAAEQHAARLKGPIRETIDSMLKPGKPEAEILELAAGKGKFNRKVLSDTLTDAVHAIMTGKNPDPKNIAEMETMRNDIHKAVRDKATQMGYTDPKMQKDEARDKALDLIANYAAWNYVKDREAIPKLAKGNFEKKIEKQNDELGPALFLQVAKVKVAKKAPENAPPETGHTKVFDVEQRLKDAIEDAKSPVNTLLNKFLNDDEKKVLPKFEEALIENGTALAKKIKSDASDAPKTSAEFAEMLIKKSCKECKMTDLGSDLDSTAIDAIIKNLRRQGASKEELGKGVLLNNLNDTLKEAYGDIVSGQARSPEKQKQAKATAQKATAEAMEKAVKERVFREVRDGAYAQVADGIVHMYRIELTGFQTWWGFSNEQSDAVVTVEHYRRQPPTNEKEEFELAKNEMILYRFAVDKGAAPSHEQITVAAGIATEGFCTAMKQSKHPEARCDDRTDLATRVEEEVVRALNLHKDEINHNAQVSTDSLNAKLSKGRNKVDLFEKIGKALGDKIKKDPEVYKMLEPAYVAMREPWESPQEKLAKTEKALGDLKKGLNDTAVGNAVGSMLYSLGIGQGQPTSERDLGRFSPKGSSGHDKPRNLN